MTALQKGPLSETPQLEDQARKFSFTVTALKLVRHWRSSSESAAGHPIYDIITLEEVSHHDHSSDCWIVLYDRVYQITHFLKEHPGGADVLLEYAGRDATIPFRGTGHTAETADYLKPYILGQLPPNECIYRKPGGIKLNGMPE